MGMEDQIKVILDEDDLTIIKPLTLDALCHYDKNHYFCGNYYKASSNFNTKGSVTYIFIDKINGRVESFRRLINNDILDSNENEVSLDDVQKNLKDYFGIKEQITKKLLGSNFFNQLRSFMRGEITARTLENADSLILRVVNNEDEEPKISLDFNDFDDFLEKIGLDDDDISFYNGVSSRGWEFRSYDSDYEDMKEGYGPFWNFDAENQKKLEYISSFLMPKVEYKESEEYFRQIFKILYDEFGRYMDDIISEWTDAVNEQMNESAYVDVNEELIQYFKNTGLDVDLTREIVKLPVSEILKIYSEVGDSRATLKELLETYFENKRGNLGGWYENAYDYENSGLVDMERLNRKWGDTLDTIIEKMEEEGEEYKRIYELYWKIKDKYDFRKVHKTPKDPNLFFQVLGIDNTTGKIQVQILTKDKDGRYDRNKIHEFDEHHFNLFLNQPELFNILDEK